MKLAHFFLFLIFLTSNSFTPPESPHSQEIRHQIFSHLPSWDFDKQLNDYLNAHTKQIQATTIEELKQIQDWPTYQKLARTQLFDMLGMNPLPAKTALKPVITGTVEYEDFTVEKLHFQSMPGLYVTANLYMPKKIEQPLPTILYVCGHANVVENGVSYGSKVNYQHHPAWFARNGYVCLIIDTFQLGEIEGIHHGTYRYGRWWWLSRGYTPAGVEAWNCIRSLDYLTSRPEVDVSRLGVTGRSGGGIYSWWIAALDERIKVAVPVAGITDMQNHVIDGCVEGHCDCMYMMNTYGWDYPKVAALVAPRPLLISNTDRDPIFPLSGVYRTFESVANVYEQLKAREDVALHTTAGPHKDTQELRVHAFRWFNHYLRGTDELIDKTAIKYFSPQELKVFDKLPKDEINTKIDEHFVPKAESTTEILSHTSWETARANWQKNIEGHLFNRWDKEAPVMGLVETHKLADKNKIKLDIYELKSDAYTRLPIFHLSRNKKTLGKVKMIVLDDSNWNFWQSCLASVYPNHELWKEEKTSAKGLTDLSEYLEEYEEIVLVSTRGAGPAHYSGDDRKQTQIRRRFYLLGQSLESLQTLDILQALETTPSLVKENTELQCEASGKTANMLIYASLFSKDNLKMELTSPFLSDKDIPPYLNILKYMDMEAVVIMAAEKHQLKVLCKKEFSDYTRWQQLLQLVRKYPQLKLEMV